MVRKINKRSVYYIKSFVNSLGLSDAGIALFTYFANIIIVPGHCVTRKGQNDNVESCRLVFLLFFSCCINEFSLDTLLYS